MKQLLTETQEKKKPVKRLAVNSKLVTTVVDAIQDKKGQDVVSLDLRKISEAVADFFVVCDANSPVQVKAIADHIVEKVEEELGEKPYHVEYGEKWTLVDFVDVVVHIFTLDYRQFYSLENLWEDAPKKNY